MDEIASSSAEEVASDPDLLSEILLHLPIKSLFRFKSVSKLWLSLITNPILLLHQNPDPNAISGFFFHATNLTFMFWNPERRTPLLELIQLDHDTDHITSFPGLSGTIILNSCHGLVLCLGYNEINQKGGYHILNPTTKQFITLLDPDLDGLEGLSLVFDPSKSLYYKVVSVTSFNRLLSDRPSPPYSYRTYYNIQIYSSETRVWCNSSETFSVNAHQMRFDEGVYWNGAIHWSSEYGDWMYFNIDEDRIGKIPDLPPASVGATRNFDRSLFHLCESRGHLHVVDAYENSTCFDVFEIERDYSKWFLKYKVDLNAMCNVSCEYEEYTVLSIVRGEKEDESFVLLHVPGKIVRYNFIDQTFKCVWNSGDQAFKSTWNEQPIDDPLLYCGAHQYIKSYYSV